MPALKEFLKGGDAESYHNVEIEYKQGKPPLMTLFAGGEVKEEVLLKEYDTNEALHQLFQEKGLQRKTLEEIAQVKLEVQKREALDLERRAAASAKRREAHQENQRWQQEARMMREELHRKEQAGNISPEELADLKEKLEEFESRNRNRNRRNPGTPPAREKHDELRRARQAQVDERRRKAEEKRLLREEEMLKMEATVKSEL